MNQPLPPRKNAWIGVDLDRTLAVFPPPEGWNGPTHIGEPIQPMVNFVKALIAEGRTVKIFTARLTEDGRNLDEIRTAIQDWLEKAGLPRLEVTNAKDNGCEALFDDIAISVVPNKGQLLLDNALAALAVAEQTVLDLQAVSKPPPPVQTLLNRLRIALGIPPVEIPEPKKIVTPPKGLIVPARR